MDLSGYEEQFKLQSIFEPDIFQKRILSFGGWSYPTSLDSHALHAWFSWNGYIDRLNPFGQRFRPKIRRLSLTNKKEKTITPCSERASSSPMFLVSPKNSDLIPSLGKTKLRMLVSQAKRTKSIQQPGFAGVPRVSERVMLLFGQRVRPNNESISTVLMPHMLDSCTNPHFQATHFHHFSMPLTGPAGSQELHYPSMPGLILFWRGI